MNNEFRTFGKAKPHERDCDCGMWERVIFMFNL